jgi:hypothetical protein
MKKLILILSCIMISSCATKKQYKNYDPKGWKMIDLTLKPDIIP